jgi:Flp pilus assembly protein TadG
MKMRLFSRSRNRKNEEGQVVVLLAFSMTLVLLFTALAVDVGFAYVTKAKLSKAVDAACLTAMRNLAQGQQTATNLATNSFNTNYAMSSLDVSPPALSVSYSKDAFGNNLVNVSATATIKTFFLGILPQYETWQVSDSAQSTRGKLVMSIILDRSGSMSADGGGAALQSAVPTFVSDFDNATDEVALISFSSNATVDIPIEYNFTTPITSAVKAMAFSGGTFGTGGTFVAGDGPPITLADNQNGSVPVQAGQNVMKAVVYFTDGLMNTIQDVLPCTSAIGPTLYNYGGFDSGNQFDFFNPATGAILGSGLDHNGFPPYNGITDCSGVTTFYSQQNKKQEAFSRANITAEAQYRAITTANAMRAENPVTYIYTIGLGGSVNATTQAFLQTVANDPANAATYNPNLPAGLFLYVPNCPSATCTSDLNTAFQTIASKILLRLTQ